MEFQEAAEILEKAEESIHQIINDIERIFRESSNFSQYEKQSVLGPDCLGLLATFVRAGKGYEAAFSNGKSIHDIMDMCEENLSEDESDEEEDEEDSDESDD